MNYVIRLCGNLGDGYSSSSPGQNVRLSMSPYTSTTGFLGKISTKEDESECPEQLLYQSYYHFFYFSVVMWTRMIWISQLLKVGSLVWASWLLNESDLFLHYAIQPIINNIQGMYNMGTFSHHFLFILWMKSLNLSHFRLRNTFFSVSVPVVFFFMRVQ